MNGKVIRFIKLWRMSWGIEKIRGKDVKNDLHKYSKEGIIIIQEDNLRNVKILNLETQNIKVKKNDFKNWINRVL